MSSKRIKQLCEMLKCIAVELYISNLCCIGEDLASYGACLHDTQQALEFSNGLLCYCMHKHKLHCNCLTCILSSAAFNSLAPCCALSLAVPTQVAPVGCIQQ